jgi:hypothetical protein
VKVQNTISLNLLNASFSPYETNWSYSIHMYYILYGLVKVIEKEMLGKRGKLVGSRHAFLILWCNVEMTSLNHAETGMVCMALDRSLGCFFGFFLCFLLDFSAAWMACRFCKLHIGNNGLRERRLARLKLLRPDAYDFEATEP